MLLCEYRIVLPVSVDEYKRGMLYMIAKSSVSDSEAAPPEAAPIRSKLLPRLATKTAAAPAPSGVVFVKNEPFTDNPHGLPPGQYTEKTYYLDAHLPAFLSALLPTGAGVLHETAWNSFPNCVTSYASPYMGDKFSLVLRSAYVDAPPAGVPVDGPPTEAPSHPLYNTVGLTAEELAARSTVDLDVSSKAFVSLVAGEDPTAWTCAAACPPRGPLPPGGAWRNGGGGGPRMVAVKVAAVHFGQRGVQGRVEAWAQRYGLRNAFVRYNRRILCWMDEWIGLTMEDIRRLEGEVKRKLESS
ncbi:hypothetical protein BU14_0022s0050 [Porphyra umbilicalis]|uniref:Phosphatidylinositol transfer protein N-terminal domain-containing protein n=1 Tax=Porphyra umbilicalis TaxID=2786 RepID=A0A1X6PKH8_PORUM|nr:hypothetical protein BU14_0022s0050 [Porphyra umbilicalis]|eukprot:OSX81330.1 hypothetical protein BU14_0022s0050 [Porphyra umbilicalis]